MDYLKPIKLLLRKKVARRKQALNGLKKYREMYWLKIEEGAFFPFLSVINNELKIMLYKDFIKKWEIK